MDSPELIHPDSKKQIEDFLDSPSHGLLLIGSHGSGSNSIASYIATRMLGDTSSNVHNLPYLKLIQQSDKNSIGIEAIRQINQFFSLKVPYTNQINRLVIIENGDLMTIEAQNSLLKNLEEPPKSTAIIITSAQPEKLLPTLRSRVQAISLKQPAKVDIMNYFVSKGYEPKLIEQLFHMSGGRPEIIQHALNSEDSTIVEDARLAKAVLASDIFERLVLIDAKLKAKEDALKIAEMIGRVARSALTSGDSTSQERWKNILIDSYAAAAAIRANSQPKLVMTNLFLQLSA